MFAGYFFFYFLLFFSYALVPIILARLLFAIGVAGIFGSLAFLFFLSTDYRYH